MRVAPKYCNDCKSADAQTLLDIPGPFPLPLKAMSPFINHLLFQL